MTAAVLLYRAVTYLPPIPLGAIACLIWRHAPALFRSSPRNADRQRDPVMQRDTADVIVAIDQKALLRRRAGGHPIRLEEAAVLHTGGHAYTHDDWITVLP